MGPPPQRPQVSARVLPASCSVLRIWTQSWSPAVLLGRSYDETGYTLVQHFNRDNASAPQAFWDEYYQRAGVYPTYQAAGAMAQGYSLEAALKVAHSMDSSSVMLALASLYEASFYGRISFGFNGMNNLKSMVVYQCVSPAHRYAVRDLHV